MSEDTKDFILKDADATRDETETSRQKTTQTAEMPEMTFATFIVSLNHSALVHLGVVEDPSSGTKSKNIELAKQTIDIITMLEEKTKGNLTAEEGEVIKSLLYELRLIYVRETSA